MAQETNMTAVEWLIEQYKKDGYIGIQREEQAKQMEKEQILDAIINNQNGLLRRKTIIEAEQYYNETYVEDKTFKKKSQWTKTDKKNL